MNAMPMNTLRAFHDDPALKNLLAFRCVASRESGVYRQGNCDEEETMQAGCAVAAMLQTARPRLEDFETQFGLSTGFARFAEMIYEALPPEAAPFFPDYIVAAVPIGADTRPIGWQILERTLSNHAGADHRIVKATVRQTLDFIAPLVVGDIVDIVDAHELMDASQKTLKKAVTAVGFQNHPIWDAALIANETLQAAATMCRKGADNIIARATRRSIRTPEDAKTTARLMAEMLMRLPSHLTDRSCGVASTGIFDETPMLTGPSRSD